MTKDHQEQTTDAGAEAIEKKVQKPPRPENALLGISAGAGMMVIGTVLWVLLSPKYQMPGMAIVIALGIACAIRYIGNTAKPWYGIVAAGLTLVASVIGNLATAIFLMSRIGKKPPLEILTQLDFGTAISLLKAIGNPLFYLAALFVGYWFAFKHTKKTYV